MDVRALVNQHLQQVMREQANSSILPANLASEWLDMQELARHMRQQIGVATVPGSRLLINPLRRDRMVQRATDRDTD